MSLKEGTYLRQLRHQQEMKKIDIESALPNVLKCAPEHLLACKGVLVMTEKDEDYQEHGELAYCLREIGPLHAYMKKIMPPDIVEAADDSHQN